MYGIEILVDEHKNIIEFCKSMKSMCCSIIEGNEVDANLVKECVAFGKTYADHLHHGKEEKILFKIMLEKLGPVADKLIRNGMLVEHDLGRLHMNELLEAIDRGEEGYTEARLILRFLQYVNEIHDIDDIPHNSIFREFIGKSVFFKEK